MTLIHKPQERLIDFDQGRSLANDDLRAIQDQLDNLSMLFAGWGAFVLTGCEVTVNANNNSLRDIAAGLVYINDHLIYFQGVDGIDLSTPQYMQEVPSIKFADRLYLGKGTDEPGLMRYRVDIGSSQPGSGEYIEFRESGAQRTKANDLDLPKAVNDVANLQENKADKGPQTSYILGGSNISFDNGYTNSVPQLKAFFDNLGYLHLKGRITYSGTQAFRAFILPSSVNGVYYTPSAPSVHTVVNVTRKGDKSPTLTIRPNGDCEIDLSVDAQSGDDIDLGEIIINPDV